MNSRTSPPMTTSPPSVTMLSPYWRNISEKCSAQNAATSPDVVTGFGSLSSWFSAIFFLSGRESTNGSMRNLTVVKPTRLRTPVSLRLVGFQTNGMFSKGFPAHTADGDAANMHKIETDSAHRDF